MAGLDSRSPPLLGVTVAVWVGGSQDAFHTPPLVLGTRYSVDANDIDIDMMPVEPLSLSESEVEEQDLDTDVR
jgi:hypothetical protein